MHQILLAVLACGLLAFLCRPDRRRLPPGPARKVLLGNIYNVPRQPEEWKGFAALGKLYGPVSYLRVLGRDVVILNSAKAVNDLLEQRSAIYSNRPRFVMANEVAGFDWLIPFMPYGNFLRQHRRALHQHLNEAAAKTWWNTQQDLNVRFLKKLIDAPGDWWDLTHWLAGANIMRMTFGIEIAKKDDPWIDLGIKVAEVASKAGSFGAFAVDIFPLLKYIPAWFPGAKFKRDAIEWRQVHVQAKNLPFQRVVKDMAAGNAMSCIARSMLEEDTKDSSLSEEVMKNALGAIYLGGADTSLAAMRGFVFAMVLNPSAQKTAQDEIDRTLSDGTLPSHPDRPHLPYVEALYRETMRMYPIAPLTPHCVTEEDEYEGMTIPKGSTVIANTWGILHDEETYPEPETFKPERFLKQGALDPDVLDPRNPAFGYGRRVCPGRHIADAELWLFIVTMLSCYNISPAEDGNGEPIIPPSTMCSGLVSSVSKFPCNIQLRNESKRKLILAEADRLKL
ncbi:cytochrome P450 [Exidia glandulosa HHB12029]|uniref:Cytochrome P450 n=1 Tax=Exidia glandulosa HHB12029 TaxID=1314781 RepID=A0A165FU16_EXIGL|nr:cytochrome P450 [Exidia glandulosa HHB12029]